MQQVIGSYHEIPVPKLQSISLSQPLQWLHLGARDMQRSPAASLGYAAVWIGAGYLMYGLLFHFGLVHFVLPVTAGFMLIGPLVAVGFYEISRRHQRSQDAFFADTWSAWGRFPSQLATLGAMLMVLFLVWIQLNVLVFALLFQGITPTWSNFITGVLLTPANLPLLLIGTAVGLGIAAFAFSLSAIAAPMLMDRKMSAFTAVLLSLNAVRNNPLPMALWGLQIVLFVGVGLLLLLLGLFVTLPLIGHATWHAYRDLVAD